MLMEKTTNTTNCETAKKSTESVNKKMAAAKGKLLKVRRDKP